jgi:hypothetical protein
VAASAAAAPAKGHASAAKHKGAGHRHHRHGRKHGRKAARRNLPTGKLSNGVAVASRPISSMLFNGKRVPDFWINHSAAGAISEVPDPAGSGETVMDMTVNNNDVYPVTPTENPRAELLSPGIVKPGQDVWLQTKFMVPTDYPSVPSDGWVSLVSFYGAPFNGPSPWHLEMAGNNLQWQRNGTYGYDVPYQAPLQRGSWTTVVVHEVFAEAGSIEMWINGQAIDFFGSGGFNPNHVAPTDKLEMATMDESNNAGANSAKIMQYRKAGMFESGSIYFGALRMGTSRASVED